MIRFFITFSLILFFGCNNSETQQNEELNRIVQSICIYHSLTNKINPEILPLTVYSSNEGDNIIYQYPSVDIEEILNAYPNYTKTDSLKILNNTYELNRINIIKDINPKLKYNTAKSNKNTFQVSSPIFFSNDQMAFIVVTKWDKLGYFQENIYILKRDLEKWNVVNSRIGQKQ